MDVMELLCTRGVCCEMISFTPGDRKITGDVRQITGV